MKSKILMIAATIALMISGCAKDGETGPQGPQGPAGNANVESYEIDILSSQWAWDGLYKQWYYDYPLSVDFRSSLYAYAIKGTGGETLPYYDHLDYTTLTFSNNLFQSPKYISFEYYNGSTTLPRPTDTEYITLIVVPPAQRLANPTLDFSDYNEVKRVFGLKEPTRLTPKND